MIPAGDHMRFAKFCFLISVSAAFSLASAEDWPRFRGADGNAAAPQATVPTSWTSSRNVLWAAEIPGHGASSPITFQDRAYVTSYSGYGLNADDDGDLSGLRLHVLCFDLSSGRLIWDREIAGSSSEQEATRRVIDHGYASGTPVCDDHGVYAYFGVSGLVAFDHDGNQLWHTMTGDRTAGFGSAASPIVYQNLVIMNASIESNTVFAFDRKTGQEAWRINDVAKSWTTPIVAQNGNGQDELIVSYKEQLRGFDPLSGKPLWSSKGIQDYVVPCVVVNEGIAYVLGGRKNQSMAVRLGGRGDVSETHKIWESNIGANVTSPLYHEGRLYWSSDRGIANCLDAATGEVIYRERMDTKERVYGSAVLAGRYLYMPTRENGVLVVAVGEEYRQVARNVLEDDDSLLNATPCVAGDTLLLRTNQKLYCIGELSL